MADRWGNSGNSVKLYFLGSKITADGDCSHEIKRQLLLGRKAMTNIYSVLKRGDITLLTKVLIVNAMIFSHVLMWELDHKEGWAPKNWCFWIVVLEKTLESPLEIKPVNPKGNQFWMFIRRTDVEAETPILWPPDVKRTHWKRPSCWERLRAGKEGADRGWDGWMASLAQWTWVWANSGR